MEQKIPSLKELYKTLTDLMLEDVLIGEDGYETNEFFYDEDGWCIEGSFKVEGYWREDGDGYWTPREYYCVSASGEMDELTVSFYDEDDNEIEVPEEEIDALYAHLEKELECYCRYV